MFTGGSAARVCRAVNGNEQRQGITMAVVPCLLRLSLLYACFGSIAAYVRTQPVRTYAVIALNAPYRCRSSSHKANLIPQSKRQDTTIIVIPCLCSFTVPSSPSAEPPINKKRTRTLFRKESGSSTNCMVDGTGLEPVTSCTSSRCSTS